MNSAMNNASRGGVTIHNINININININSIK